MTFLNLRKNISSYIMRQLTFLKPLSDVYSAGKENNMHNTLKYYVAQQPKKIMRHVGSMEENGLYL